MLSSYIGTLGAGSVNSAPPSRLALTEQPVHGWSYVGRSFTNGDVQTNVGWGFPVTAAPISVVLAAASVRVSS